MHTTTIHVRWGELDPYNHVNHSVYSSYLEHARVEALASIDSGMEALTASGLQIVVVRSDVRFRAPATAGDELTISTWLSSVRGASMTWQQRIERHGALVVEAEIRAACRGSDGKPVRIPQTLRGALESLTPTLG